MELDDILAPINGRQEEPKSSWAFGVFVEKVYLPFYPRKWKPSTASTNEYRINSKLLREFSERSLVSFSRDDLQDFLDSQVNDHGLSFSTVAHLRWDLHQIFRMAVEEGYVKRNPASLLFTPRQAARPQKRVMTWKEVGLCLTVMDLREELICALAIIAGMRPGEIFALEWKHIQPDHISVRQRLYRARLDTPKRHQSVRDIGLSNGLKQTIEKWRAGSGVESRWVFPSENADTPLTPGNVWRRRIGPQLRQVGLDGVSFQLRRRTHSSLMNGLGVDPKVVADQLGHSLDVNQNVYTDSGLARRTDALNLFERTLHSEDHRASSIM